MGEKFVLTGGQGDNAEGPYGPSITRVTEYNINGFVKDLPEMITPRFLHGCSHFTNKDNKNVFIGFRIFKFDFGFVGSACSRRIQRTV